VKCLCGEFLGELYFIFFAYIFFLFSLALELYTQPNVSTLQFGVFFRGDCEKEYLHGSVQSPVWYTPKKHQKAVSNLNKGNWSLAEHLCGTKHVIAWVNSKNVTTITIATVKDVA
jgi:hypothetical protein